MTLSLARRAERFPDRTAVVDVSEEDPYAPARTIDEDRVSYATLSAVADETVARLSRLRIGPGDTVCLLTRNRVASLAFVFACRRLGATLAPISHLLTPVTVERPFDVLDPSLVVYEMAQYDLVRSIPVDRAVTLEELADVDPVDEAPPGGPGTDGTDAPPVGHEADVEGGERDSTRRLLLHGEGGRPVVGFDERGLEYNCLTAVVTWGLSRADVVPLVGPLSTGGGLVRVALPTLYAGGHLLLDRAFDPGDALTAMASEGATFVAGRPTAIRDLAAESGFAAATDALERVAVDGPIDEEVRTAYLDRGVPVGRIDGRLECPTAFSGAIPADASRNTAETDDVGWPVPDCRARLVADGSVVEGAGEGRLELAGPILATGYLGGAGADPGNRNEGEGGDPGGDPSRDDEALEERTDERPSGTADRGRFVDGWFDTNTRFRRDADGRYVPLSE